MGGVYKASTYCKSDAPLRAKPCVPGQWYVFRFDEITGKDEQSLRFCAQIRGKLCMINAQGKKKAEGESWCTEEQYRPVDVDLVIRDT